jgi:hypothetical protein
MLLRSRAGVVQISVMPMRKCASRNRASLGVEGFHPKRDFRSLDGQVSDLDTGDPVLNDVGRGGAQGGGVGFGSAHQESYAVKFDNAVNYLRAHGNHCINAQRYVSVTRYRSNGRSSRTASLSQAASSRDYGLVPFQSTSVHPSAGSPRTTTYPVLDSGCVCSRSVCGFLTFISVHTAIAAPCEKATGCRSPLS